MRDYYLYSEFLFFLLLFHRKVFVINRRLRKWMAWNTTSGHEVWASDRPQNRPTRRASGRWSSQTFRDAVAERHFRSRGSRAVRDNPWVCHSTGNHDGRDTTLRSRPAVRESDRRRMRLDGTTAATIVTVAPGRPRVGPSSASVAVSRTSSHRSCYRTSEAPASGDAERTMTEVLGGERNVRKQGN